MVKEKSTASILLVQDDVDLLETLALTLEDHGFLVTVAKTYHEALAIVTHHAFDLLLLEVIFEAQSGYELCRLLRKRMAFSDLAIIFLTTRSAEVDRIVGFEVGCDDYIIKPFSVRELILRIEAVLRRKNAHQADTSFSFGSISADIERPRVTVEGQEITLTSLELRLLHLLYLRKGRVQTRAQLLQNVWQIEADITTRTVDTHIKRLRKKLASLSYYIKTVRGLGYRFITTEELREHKGHDTAEAC